MRTTLSAFRSQLSAIMETLAKTAVLEISQLVEIECRILGAEVVRSHQEIEALRRRLQLMELMQRKDFPNEKEGHTVPKSTQGTCPGQGCPSTDSPALIKRESNLEELSICVAAMGDSTEAVERQSEHLLLCQSSKISIKQEPNGDVQNSGIRKEEERTHEEIASTTGCGAEENSSSKNLTNDVADVGTQRMKTTSPATPADTNAHVPERPVLLPQTRSETQKKASSQSFLLPNPVRNSGFVGEKRFGCPHCAKWFKCFSQLKIHERSHTGEKPFQCTLCGKRYAQKGHLYTHQRTHTGEKPYRCLHCGKGFIQKCTLDMHRRTHTGEKPFTCTKCGKAFTKKCTLNKHFTVHSDPASGLHMESGLHEPSIR